MHRTLPCWTLVLVLTSLWLMSHGKAAEAGEPQELIRQTLTGVLAVLTDDTLGPCTASGTPQTHRAGGIAKL